MSSRIRRRLSGLEPPVGQCRAGDERRTRQRFESRNHGVDQRLLFFHFDDGTKRWTRVFEGLTIGIDPEVSHVLDIHRLGEAVDIARPRSSDERTFLVDYGYGSGWVPVSYDKFIHLHPSGAESYYVDKRGFTRLAAELVPSVKWSSVDTECTLFDVPDIYRVSLSHDSGHFELVARTVNDQEWKVSFSGIDGEGHLAHKVIDARLIKK